MDEKKGIRFQLETTDYKSFTLHIKSPDILDAEQFIRLIAEWVVEEAESMADDDRKTVKPKKQLLFKKGVH